MVYEEKDNPNQKIISIKKERHVRNDLTVHGGYHAVYAANVWMASQFRRPDLGEGMVQAFRSYNASSDVALVSYEPRGLDPTASYRVTNINNSVGNSTKHIKAMADYHLIVSKAQRGMLILLSWCCHHGAGWQREQPRQHGHQAYAI